MRISQPESEFVSPNSENKESPPPPLSLEAHTPYDVHACTSPRIRKVFCDGERLRVSTSSRMIPGEEKQKTLLHRFHASTAADEPTRASKRPANHGTPPVLQPTRLVCSPTREGLPSLPCVSRKLKQLILPRFFRPNDTSSAR